MSKKKVPAEKNKSIVDCPIMKALEQSMSVNNFQTNFQFSRDLGIELLKGSASHEQTEVLKKSIQGIKDFITLIEEKLKGKEEREAKEKEV